MVHVRAGLQVALVARLVRGRARDGRRERHLLVPAVALGSAIEASLTLPPIRITHRSTWLARALLTHTKLHTFPSIYFEQ